MTFRQHMQGAGLVVKALETEGVDTVFGYPGGAIMPLYDALLGSKLRHILVRHEQAAALAADAYGRISGLPGVCLATSGPGATNLITGIANAALDSVPMVAITGQVASPLMGTDAFQEVDIYGISMPLVKHSFLPRTVEELPRVIKQAFNIARSGRPGPVLIDLPKDIALQTAPEPVQWEASKADAMPRPEARQLSQAREMIAHSRRPVLYVGGGVRIARACMELRAFILATGIPVVTTLQGIGSVPGSARLNLGMLGMHGTKAANYAVHDCDLLIAIGARFDDRVTGKLAEFAPGARIIHIDGDASEPGKLKAVDCAITGDVKIAMNFLHVQPEIGPWVEQCLQNKVEFAWRYDAPGDFVYAPGFIRQLSNYCDGETIITCDVGQHQMWVAQHYQFSRPEHHLSSGGLGTMGYGLPAAIGACLAKPEARVICVSGDGSIMMNIQELATIKRYCLPVKVVLFDNQRLGMVRQWQELFFQERYSEVDLSDNPDFALVASAFGIPAITVTNRQEIMPAIDRLVNEDGPLFVHVLIDPQENVWPLVPPGKCNAQMMEARAL